MKIIPFALALTTAAAFSQGPLAPSAAPAPTMKSLAQAEPRTLLSAASTPGDAAAVFVINQPGSYYLTSNVVGVAGKNGIRIGSSGVTLDLMGFALLGGAGMPNGILASAGTTNLAILNGAATGWSQHGIDTHDASSALLKDLRTTANSGRGINAGSNTIITQCIASNNGGDGLSADNGVSIKDCVAAANGGAGISIGSSATLADCVVPFNLANGITAGSGSLIKHCVANSNGSGSSGSGISAGKSAVIRDCIADLNQYDGIRVTSDGSLLNNHASGNGVGTQGAGIHTTGVNNHIDQNQTSDNSGYGILSDAGAGVDVTVRNNSRSNFQGGYSPNSGNTFGPLGAPATATSPWANFLGTFNLTVTTEGTGNGTVSSSPAGINCGSSCVNSFEVNVIVTLTATPAAGSVFTGWSGAASGMGPAIVTMDEAKSVTATFTASVEYALTITNSGTGSGTVTSAPAGISCGATCTANFGDGTVVSLTATPAAGSVFSGWSGAASGTGSAIVSMDAAKSVTATFTVIPQYLLAVSKSGTGTGLVTSSPAGINCAGICTANYDSGTVVTLTATPAVGSVFSGWSGAASGMGSAIVTMDAARAVTATFTVIPQYLLTVSKSGTGTGLVTSSPAGINCAGICTANYDSGTVVTLTATPAVGSVFSGWSGAASGMGSAIVTMDAARAVTATFTVIPQYLLTVSKSGTGTGLVTSSPAGINCAGTCTANYDSGTVVTLTATPAVGSTFAGWSGDASGVGSAIVSMDAAKTVTATFTSP